MMQPEIMGPQAEPGVTNTDSHHATDTSQSNGNGQWAAIEELKALARKNGLLEPPKNLDEPVSAGDDPQDPDDDDQDCAPGADSPDGDDEAQEGDFFDKGGRPEAGPRIWDATKLKPAEQPRWLAKSRLPRAVLTLLLGDEGIGKSLFWAVLITHITTGKAFEGFGMPVREPGLVVLVLTEDDWSTDILPRLKILGADLNMV